jgi:hypothetical protein
VVGQATLAGLGTACALAGGGLLYLASPHQRATARALPRRPLLATGAGAQLVALAAFLGAAGPAAAVFIWITAAMTVWSIAPLATVWRRRGTRR